MMIDRVMRIAGLGLSAALLSACAAAPQVPEDSFYRLDIAAVSPGLPSPALDGILSVQVVAGAPLYRERAILYSEADPPARLRRYHYHYWIDSPPPLLRAGFVDYLRGSALARRVVVPEDGVEPDYRLRAVLDRFEHRRGPQGGRVVVSWNIMLVERASGRVLHQDRIATGADVHGDEFTAVAAAFARAVAELYDVSLYRLRRPTEGVAEASSPGKPASRP